MFQKPVLKTLTGPYGPVSLLYSLMLLSALFFVSAVPMPAEDNESPAPPAVKNDVSAPPRTDSSGPVSIDEVSDMLETRGMEREESARILEACREAEDRDVPLSMLTPRIREGLAKKIPSPRVAKALQDETEDLSMARSVIRQVSGAGHFLEHHHLWQRTANLLAADISPGIIRALIELSAAEPDIYQPASALYAALSEWGLTEDEAMRVVRAAAASSLALDEYSQIPSLFSRARREYISPDEIAQRIVSELPQVKTTKQLEKRVLQARR